MKYAIMSDVHANPTALETALADARALGCEKFVLLGDITGYGYDASQALRLARENFDIVLLGNHDSACLGLENRPSDLMNPNYDLDRRQRDQLTADELKWLRTRRPVRIADGMAFTHGDFTAPRAWNYIYEPGAVAVNFEARREKLLFCGHTHHAEVWCVSKDRTVSRPSDGRIEDPSGEPQLLEFKREKGSRYIVNVGSVGYPRSDFCVTYAICDPATDTFALRRLPFDFGAYFKAMLDHGVDPPAWLFYLLAALRG